MAVATVVALDSAFAWPGSCDVNARCLDDGFDFLEVETFDGQKLGRERRLD
jgi:hypothetical protein